MSWWLWLFLFFIVFEVADHIGPMLTAIEKRIGNVAPKVARSRKPPKVAGPPDYVCVCKHVVSVHELDPATMLYGKCRDTRVKNSLSPCACLRYTGPVPPEDYLRMST